MAVPVRNLIDAFAVLKPDLRVEAVEVSPSLYADLDRDFSGFGGHVLIAAHEFSSDWPTWEKHPAGDEIVMLLSGQATLVVRTGTGDESIVLEKAGSYVVIPRNTWHTARVPRSARMLFVTPGEGTENREAP